MDLVKLRNCGYYWWSWFLQGLLLWWLLFWNPDVYIIADWRVRLVLELPALFLLLEAAITILALRHFLRSTIKDQWFFHDQPLTLKMLDVLFLMKSMLLLILKRLRPRRTSIFQISLRSFNTTSFEYNNSIIWLSREHYVLDYLRVIPWVYLQTIVALNDLGELVVLSLCSFPIAWVCIIFY